MRGVALVAGTLATLVFRAYAAPTDEEFLEQRLRDLTRRYDEQTRRVSAQAVAVRTAVVRELAHLPFEGPVRERAGKLLARVVTGDSSYRVRADAALALGRVGTPAGLQALYRGLFGEDGRSRRFALLHTVLPEALGSLRHADGLDWLARAILRPAARRASNSLLRQAGPLRQAMVSLTLEGLGLAGARVLGADIEALARSDQPAAVRRAAVRALVRLDLAGDRIREALASRDDGLRAAAAKYPRLTQEEFEAVLADRSAVVRRHAIAGMRGHPPREAVGPLIARLREEDLEPLRLDVADALNHLTGKEFGTDAQLWDGWWAANRHRFTTPGARDPDARVYFFQVPLRTRRIVFLIDVSASMSREDEQRISRIEHAARELESTLARLRRGTAFRVVAFSSSLKRYPERSLAEAPEGAKPAAEWLRSLVPAGATNTLGALMAALSAPVVPDTIVLLSDGNPYRCSWRGKTWSEHEQILEAVREANREKQVHIHAVALLNGAYLADDDEDTSAASAFLRRLAEQNRGDFREIR